MTKKKSMFKSQEKLSLTFWKNPLDKKGGFFLVSLKIFLLFYVMEISMAKEKIKILLVDDEENNCILLRQLLQQEYEITVAYCGTEAIKLANLIVPDIILLDIIMPGMDGFEVIKVLKLSERTKNIPVIFLTGLSAPESEEKGLAMGAEFYISKPFHLVTVQLRIRSLVEKLRLK